MTHHLPDGYTSLTPFLCIDGASAAIEFYTSVFGATVVSRNDRPDGKVTHAELQLESGRLQLSDPDPTITWSPRPGRTTSATPRFSTSPTSMRCTRGPSPPVRRATRSRPPSSLATVRA